MTVSKPSWFTQAVNTPYETQRVSINGCTLEYYQWKNQEKEDTHKKNKPLLLLVHGNGGHANWWDFIAPSFIDHYCVCAVHLSGMGNSDYRDEYSFDVYAHDLIAVAKHAGYEQDITIVGHSMGGMITLRCAENYPDAIKAVVIIDSPLVFRRSDDPAESHKPPPPKHHSFNGKKYYPDFETACSRFKLVPPQPCTNQFLLEHIAQHSIRQFEQGWSWKFDDGIYFNFKREETRPVYNLDNIQCPLTYLYGNKSALVPQNIIPDIHELLKNKPSIKEENVIEITNAHHHVLVDEPLQLINVLTETLFPA